jgi:hypothetical protein
LRRSRKTEGVAVAVALDAVCASLRDRVEIVEVARELGEALEELAHALWAADLRIALAGEVDERQAQQVAGAFVDENLHGVFEGADMAFEPGAVVCPVGEAFNVFGISDPAHHHLQPAAHEFA